MLESVVHPVSGRRILVLAALAVAALVSACGGAEQNAGEPHANFPVSVSSSFPTSQRLAEQSSFTVTVRNTGRATIPNVAVTVTNPKFGSAAQAFGLLIPANGPGQPILASRSRPVWIVNQAPGPCGYSCRNRGPGAAATAYSDTWALGRLAPGRTATFQWRLTAVQAGAYTVEYQVAAGLNGYAKAVLSGGTAARGSYHVRISSAPPPTTVEPNGQVVESG
jgi:uncharacterized repeat protein (TIGR01451 family)